MKYMYSVFFWFMDCFATDGQNPFLGQSLLTFTPQTFCQACKTLSEIHFRMLTSTMSARIQCYRQFLWDHSRLWYSYWDLRGKCPPCIHFAITFSAKILHTIICVKWDCESFCYFVVKNISCLYVQAPCQFSWGILFSFQLKASFIHPCCRIYQEVR